MTTWTARVEWLVDDLTPALVDDLRVAAEPKELAEFKEAIDPRDHRVFLGALVSSKLEFAHRMIRKLPAARAALPDGDFRDGKNIVLWAESIAHELGAGADGRWGLGGGSSLS